MALDKAESLTCLTYSMGYVVFLKDGPHHQLMKVEKKFKKNKQKKEKKPKHESYAVFGE